MILSDTIKVRYKVDTKDRNTVEMAKLLKDYRVKRFLMSITDRSVTMRVPQDAIKSNRKIMEGIRNGKD